MNNKIIFVILFLMLITPIAYSKQIDFMQCGWDLPTGIYPLDSGRNLWGSKDSKKLIILEKKEFNSNIVGIWVVFNPPRFYEKEVFFKKEKRFSVRVFGSFRVESEEYFGPDWFVVESNLQVGTMYVGGLTKSEIIKFTSKCIENIEYSSYF